MNKKIIWAVVVIVIIGLIVWIINKDSSAGSASKETIKLGVIAGTTGQYAPAGEGYLKGFQLALGEWNASHDLKFDAIVEDDGFEAAKGLSAYKKLSGSDKVDAYAILSSFTIDAVYNLVHMESKPIALGFEQSKPAEDDNIFQVLPAARPVQVALGNKVQELGYTKPVAAVSNNTSVYQNFYEGFNEGFGADVKKFNIGNDTTGIRSQALAIIETKPDLVAFFMAPKDGALLVKELLKITSSTGRPHFAFDQSIQSGSTDYKMVLGTEMAEINGSIVSMSRNDHIDNFTRVYKERYQSDPPFGSDMGYNAFMLLATTYNADADVWIMNMKAAKFVGADGEVSFDETGLRVPTVFFGKIQNGEVVQ